MTEDHVWFSSIKFSANSFGIYRLKLTTEILEQGVKYVQSLQ